MRTGAQSPRLHIVPHSVCLCSPVLLCSLGGDNLGNSWDPWPVYASWVIRDRFKSKARTDTLGRPLTAYTLQHACAGTQYINMHTGMQPPLTSASVHLKPASDFLQILNTHGTFIKCTYMHTYIHKHTKNF